MNPDIVAPIKAKCLSWLRRVGRTQEGTRLIDVRKGTPEGKRPLGTKKGSRTSERMDANTKMANIGALKENLECNEICRS